MDKNGDGFVVRNEAQEPILSISVDDLLDQIIEGRPKTFEDRRGPRVNMALHAKVTDPGGFKFDGITETISGGGVFIETPTQLPLGSSLDIEIRLPYEPGDPIHASGEVIWSRPETERIVKFPGMGVKFKGVSKEDRSRIIELVDMITKAQVGGGGK